MFLHRGISRDTMGSDLVDGEVCAVISSPAMLGSAVLACVVLAMVVRHHGGYAAGGVDHWLSLDGQPQMP
jgi:hypothetical protein